MATQVSVFPLFLAQQDPQSFVQTEVEERKLLQ
jgi:hypothetical protein